jgi:hypothetical protein
MARQAPLETLAAGPRESRRPVAIARVDRRHRPHRGRDAH